MDPCDPAITRGTLSPSPISISRGGYASTSVQIILDNAASGGSVTLTPTVSNVTFDPASVVVASGATSSASFTMTANSNATLGDNTIAVGVSGSAPNLDGLSSFSIVGALSVVVGCTTMPSSTSALTFPSGCSPVANGTCSAVCKAGYYHNVDPDGAHWSWIGGPTTAGESGAWTSPGENVDNRPGARMEASTWTLDGKLWLFGGRTASGNASTAMSDLFYWNPGTKLWSWVDGSNLAAVQPTYNTKGTENASTKPGQDGALPPVEVHTATQSNSGSSGDRGKMATM